jgi:4-amino-4-deoxy-L-arabinose transferase-like glycosyltransferase
MQMKSFPRKRERRSEVNELEKMDTVTLFGLIAVSMMLITYAMEQHSHWFVLAFAFACALGSAYGFLQGAWPFGLIEAVWALFALKRWKDRRGSA